MSDAQIRTFLVDDHKVVRRGLAGFLATEPGIEVVGDAGDGLEALEQLSRLDDAGNRPDVILMDLQMEPMDGVQATREIRARFPDIGVLVLTSFVEEERVHAALEAGASGYLLKDADADEVVIAIRAAHRGEVHIDPAIAKRLIASMRPPPQPPSEPEPGLVRTLPRTKFEPSIGAGEHIVQPELLAALSATDAHVILVCAPAGYGKSVLLSRWQATQLDPVAWISLDPEDNHAPDLWSAILAGLSTQLDGFAALRAVAARLGDREVRSAVLVPLVNLAAELDVGVSIVLDDLHVITDAEALSSLDWFLRHMPRSLRVVLSTEVEPEVPAVATLRAHGDLADFRSEDLALRPAQTRQFLEERFGSEIDADEIDELERRIEGWPAALWLVTLALRRGEAPAEILARLETGGLAQDLGREVLRTQTDDVRRFLLRTSIFDRFSAPLCEEVLEDPEAARVLRRIAAAGMLVVPLDHRHSWFRYHPLLRDLLRSELRREDPDLWHALHLRAGRWFERSGEVREAMVHYIASECWDAAAELLGRTYLAVGPISGRVRAWLEAIPEPVRRADARLCQVGAWLAGVTGDRAGMELWLGQAAASGWTAPLPDGSPSVQGAELMLRTALSYDDLGRAADSSAQALATPGPPGPAWTLLEAYTAVVMYGLGRYDEADEHARAAHELGLRNPSQYANHLVPAVRALVALRRGDSAAARPLIDEATAAREGTGFAASPHALLVVCAQARYLIDEGRAAEATESCEEALQLDPVQLGIASSSIVFVPSALIELARARAVLGDSAGARRALDEARELVSGAVDAGAIPDWIDEVAAAIGAPQPAPAIGVQTRRDPDDLSQRELEILRLLAGTMSLRELANELYISHNTIKTHLRTLYRKLGVSSREEAVARAREAGLLARRART